MTDRLPTRHWLWFYWPAALVFIALVMFAPFEYLALHSEDGPTFSAFMATMTYSTGWVGVMWTFFWGMLVGGLLVHFIGWRAMPRRALGSNEPLHGDQI